jgi:hypothetical protein
LACENWLKRPRFPTNTITRLESGEELKERTIEAIRAALETMGAEFTNGERDGVKLRKQP